MALVTLALQNLPRVLVLYSLLVPGRCFSTQNCRVARYMALVALALQNFAGV
jgi:hypothetical protein